MVSSESNPRRASADDRTRPSRRLVVFTRYPEPGRTKTRLAGAIGARGAAELQREMTRRILGVAGRFAAARNAQVEVRFEGGGEPLMRQMFPGEYRFVPQGEGDLGRRMARAFEDNLRGGARAVIVGSDCPGVTVETLDEAFRALEDRDAVFGPAGDGGYYLVGLKRPEAGLFREMEWGTGEVLQRSLERARELDLSVVLLDELDDVDRPEDLAVWRRHGNEDALARISVIVAAFNDEDTIGAALVVPLAAGAEVIVADGGSCDRTVEIAAALGAAVIEAPSGRARQMNAAGRAAACEALLFLHADSRLGDGFAGEVARILSERGVAGGAFTFKPEGQVRGLDLAARLINFRSRRLQMPYGDQAIFVKSRVFGEMGGFPELPVMEDFEFVHRLKRKGRVVVSPLPVVTSARRWEEVGVLKTILINQLMIAGYFLGVSPARLARWYGRKRTIP